MWAPVAALALVTVTSAGLVRRETTEIDYFASSPVEFIYPPARTTFNATTAAYDPCGGAAMSSTRTSFPASGGQISIESLTVAANIALMYVNSADPTAYHQFSAYTDTILAMSPGGYCTTAPDFTSLGISGDVTLMVFYQLYGSETFYYQCADITISSSASTASYTCSNSSTVLVLADDDTEYTTQTYNIYNTGSATAGATVTATVTSTSSSSGLSAAAGGGIGAVVGIGVFAVALVAASMAGYVGFGKRRRIVIQDHESINSTYPLQKVH